MTMALNLYILLALAIYLAVAHGAATLQIELKQGTIPFFDIQIAYKMYVIVNPGPEEG